MSVCCAIAIPVTSPRSSRRWRNRPRPMPARTLTPASSPPSASVIGRRCGPSSPRCRPNSAAASTTRCSPTSPSARRTASASRMSSPSPMPRLVNSPTSSSARSARCSARSSHPTKVSGSPSGCPVVPRNWAARIPPVGLLRAASCSPAASVISRRLTSLMASSWIRSLTKAFARRSPPSSPPNRPPSSPSATRSRAFGTTTWPSSVPRRRSTTGRRVRPLARCSACSRRSRPPC